MQYKKFEREDGTANLVAFFEGNLLDASTDHPNWDAIIEALDDGTPDQEIADLFDVARVVARRFEALSERVRVGNGRVYFDGDEVDTVLTRQIVRFLDEGQDFAPLVKFYERLAQNPNQESVEQLYRWLNSHEFTITEDGKIIGYKGVQRSKNGGYESVKTGKAIVNGVEHNGNIPNNAGDVVEMARTEVTFDPDLTCSYGLHVGTWKYAQDWGRNGAVLKVLVDPRDVVSVPSDSSDQKLRACRYTVLEVIEQEIKESVVSYADFDDDEDDGYEECEDCGDCRCCECSCDEDSDGQVTDSWGPWGTVTDVTKAVDVTTKLVDSTLPWPQYCQTCKGPCNIRF